MIVKMLVFFLLFSLHLYVNQPFKWHDHIRVDRAHVMLQFSLTEMPSPMDIWRLLEVKRISRKHFSQMQLEKNIFSFCKYWIAFRVLQFFAKVKKTCVFGWTFFFSRKIRRLFLIEIIQHFLKPNTMKLIPVKIHKINEQSLDLVLLNLYARTSRCISVFCNEIFLVCS